ncbi:MAG: ATP-dependent helicase [Erysipelotrichaceae bacterium]|nr:ATP-dependent helicase [Erysipelotrichaceae bacterium]
MSKAKKSKIYGAIEVVCKYLIKDEFQQKKVFNILCAIADPEDTIPMFLNRISMIESIVKQKNDEEEKKGSALSSIHAAKGLEFNTVYLADVYDKVCPRVLSNEDHKLYEEERRILYVGMTRAKDKLEFINALDKKSEFIEEIINGKRKPRVFRATSQQLKN